MDETGGRLRPVVERYLRREKLSPEDISLIRAYLRQWIMALVWDQNPHAGPDARAFLNELRQQIDGLTDRYAIVSWLDMAAEAGMDPL
jgi:hypothetical protein